MNISIIETLQTTVSADISHICDMCVNFGPEKARAEEVMTTVNQLSQTHEDWSIRM